MPRTRGRQRQRVSPTDTGGTPAPSTPSSLTIELSALTAAALRTRLRERNLPASGNKAALIERLEQSTSADDPGTQRDQPADSATPPSHQADPPALAQQTPPSGSVTQHRTDTTSGGNPRAATTSVNIPTNLLAQLQTYLEHATETQQVTGTQQTTETRQTNIPGISRIAEDQLSDASDLPRNNQDLPPVIANVAPPPQLNPQQQSHPPHPGIPTHHPLSTESTANKTPLPPVPQHILDKIRKGEYVDFGRLTSKEMYGASEPQTSFTLEVNPSGDSFAIQPTSSHKRITSFPTWLESWNIFLAIMVNHNPSKASELIAYQAIITSASRQYPLHAWLNYDTQFRVTAATDHTLRWDTRHSDLWFKCITPFSTATQPGRFPCIHCGQTSHYPENCNFRRSPAQPLDQRPAARPTTNRDPKTPVCKDFNNSTCTRTPCRYLHQCERCSGNHPRSACPNNRGMH